jgi:hypothetical protein
MQIRVVRLGAGSPLLGVLLAVLGAALLLAVLVFGMALLAGAAVIGSAVLLGRRLFGAGRPVPPWPSAESLEPPLDPSREVRAGEVLDGTVLDDTMRADRRAGRLPPGPR